jgi:hypothetical protein
VPALLPLLRGVVEDALRARAAGVMARPTTACACNEPVRVTIGGQVQVVHCARRAGHPYRHQGKVSWAPRCAPAPNHAKRTE